MFTTNEYQLIDFGKGRRLERFRGLVIDRPCPTAEGLGLSRPEAWGQADIRYERNAEGKGAWSQMERAPEDWSVCHGPVQLELRPTPLGQVGVFPEQAENWDWIEARIHRAGRPLRILNLFAYTGGATLAAAAAGAEVVHLDAAKTVVAWARRNASLSSLDSAPIRWIVDDATKFVDREVRRGNRYDAVVLDPPSYGHGPKGETWKIEKHLGSLLGRCAALTGGRPEFILVSCHSPGLTPGGLKGCLADSFRGVPAGSVQVHPLYLRTSDGRKLPSGLAASWPE